MSWDGAESRKPIDFSNPPKIFWPTVKKYSPDQARDYHGRFADEGGGEERTVGITTAKPGRSARDVYREGAKFESKLKALPGVSDASVTPAVGDTAEWGKEPSWNVNYRGNGEARALIGQVASGEMFGESTRQDSAFIATGGCRGPDCSPTVEFRFSGHLSPDREALVHEHLAGAGLGGWTIGHSGADTTYRAVYVKEYAGDKTKADFRRSSHEAFETLSEAKIPFRISRDNVSVEVLSEKNRYGRP